MCKKAETFKTKRANTMRHKKIISFTLALILLFLALVGCSVVRYDAEIYSYVNDWLDPAFLENNRLGNVDYENPDYDRDLADEAEAEGLTYEIPKYFNFPDNPDTRTFIITDQEAFDSMFVEGAIEVDFEKEMVLLYMFRSWQPPRVDYYCIDKIKVQDELVNVYFAKENKENRRKDSVYSYHRCIAVRMKKIEVTTANFEYVLGG